MSLDRRQFFGAAGIGSAGALLLPNSFVFAHDQAQHARQISRETPLVLPATERQQRFFVQPGAYLSLADTTPEINAIHPWAITSTASIDPAILLNPMIPDLEAAVTWVDNQADMSSETARLLTTLANLSVTGADIAPDVSVAAIEAVRAGTNFDVSLEFLLDETQELYRPAVVEFEQGLPFVVGGNSTSRVGTQGFNPPKTIFEAGGWKLQFRGVETHQFSSCLYPRQITHVHYDIHRSTRPGRYTKVTTFHIGTYVDRGRRCFVLYNSYPRVCWSICSPSRRDLETLLKWSLVAAAAIAGVALAGWIAPSLSAAAAVAVFAALLYIV